MIICGRGKTPPLTKDKWYGHTHQSHPTCVGLHWLDPVGGTPPTTHFSHMCRSWSVAHTYMQGVWLETWLVGAHSLGPTHWVWLGLRNLLPHKFLRSILHAGKSWGHLTPRVTGWKGMERGTEICSRGAQARPRHHTLPNDRRSILIRSWLTPPELCTWPNPVVSTEQRTSNQRSKLHINKK